MAFLKNKGLTLTEISIALLAFTIGIGVFVSSYINLVRQNIANQKYQATIGNLRLGLEKIWRDIKYGVDFVTSTDKISFKRSYDCQQEKIYLDNINGILMYEIEGISSPLTDPNIIKIEKLKIFSKGTSTLPNATPTVMLVTLSVVGKAKIGFQDIPINFQFSVAPINSIFLGSPCPSP